MSRRVVVVILRAFPDRFPRVSPPATAAEIAFDGTFDAPGLLRTYSIGPELVLLDLRGLELAESSGVLIAAARAACGKAHIVVIGTPNDEHMAKQALIAGAAGFVSRDLSENALENAIANASRGALHLTSTGIRAVNKLVDPLRAKPKD